MGARALRAALGTTALLAVAAPALQVACDEGVAASPTSIPPSAQTPFEAGSYVDALAEEPGADGPEPDGGDASACPVGANGEPLDLQCTGLYADWASKTIAAGVEAYTPAFAMWSDGASARRWIALPPGASIDTSDLDDWTFPVDTRVWQELSLPLGDASELVRVETRFLWRSSAGWVRTTYRWSDDGETSATDLPAGEPNVRGTGYEVPANFECDQCHQTRAKHVLGFDAVSLSAPGASGLTMQVLVARGLLTEPPAVLPMVPGNAIESAALGWLHANCGTACHNDVQGTAGTSGLLMRLDVATLASVQTTNAYRTGWDQPTSGWQLDGSTTYRILPCNPPSSAAYYRADVRDGVGGVTFGTQMPTVWTHEVDVADLAVFASWIDEGCDGGAGGP
jgi:hypothetical protein